MRHLWSFLQMTSSKRRIASEREYILFRRLFFWTPLVKTGAVHIVLSAGSETPPHFQPVSKNTDKLSPSNNKFFDV